MTPDKINIQSIQGDLKKISQKLRFLVKVVNRAENEGEKEICLEMASREMLAYSDALEEMVTGLNLVAAAPTPAAPPVPPPPARAGRTEGAKPGAAKGGPGATTLDFAIGD
jgi:hypothetical protein